jgi:iron complex outermembrane receptor protein
MKYLLMLLACIVGFIQPVYSQITLNITGKVVDENDRPLLGATIVLSPGNIGTAADAGGRFTFSGLKPGEYVMHVSFMGYEDHIDTLTIEDNREWNIRMEPSLVNLQEVVVTGDYAEIRKREESLNLEIVNEKYLKQNLGGSIMNSLERLPGVSAIAIGSGQSKPVIRGLGFNRVVVVENNIKHEAQQWGADHGLEIDQYAIDQVEVILGPASLRYGSDAIGGVIDMKNKQIPAENTFGGTIDLTGKTYNDFLGTSISLYGRKHGFFGDLRMSIVDYGDYKVPADSVDIYSYRVALNERRLRNTAGNELNLHTSFGIVQPRFQSRFHVSSVNSKSGFFANTHGLEPRRVDEELHDQSNRDIHYPYHTVHHFKAINTSQYEWDRLRLELDLGFQRNFRQEWSKYVDHGYMPPVFPDTMDYDSDLERQFEKYVYSGNVDLSYPFNENTGLNLGINSEYQDNRIDGRGFIIPAFKQMTAGTYLYVKHAFSKKSLIQLGIRGDYGRIQTEEYHDWFPSPVVANGDTSMQYLQRASEIERSFSNLSWSLGYNHNLDRWSFKANMGKSFRMPIAKELAANGVNYHRFSYEVGDADLSPEIAYQLDGGIEYRSSRLAIGTSPFLNYFPNYIYLNPSAEHDQLYGNGNQVFYYTQSRVLRYGAELHAHYELFRFLQLGLIGEYVYSQQLSGEKKGFTLPFSPPASGIFNIKYQKYGMKFAEYVYVSLDYRITAPQNNIVPPEETTDGYQLINLGFGCDFHLKGQKLSLSMQVQNLFNTKYFNHTSYYRLIHVPEPGRSFILNITLPFSGDIKQK